MSEEFDLNEFAKPERKPIKRKKKKAVSLKTKFWLGVTTSILIVTGVAYCAERYADWRAEHEWQSPIRWVGFVRKVEAEEPIAQAAIIAHQPEVLAEPKQVWTGQASYYSFDGCIGCNPNRIMANGEVLNDMNKTLAFNKLPMNTEVVVTNLSNGTKTTAIVTDTGGFEELGRIADLSVATKEVLGCSDLCQIRIEVF